VAYFSVAKIKKILKIITISIVCIFALIGIAFSSVYVGMQYGIFNVRGSITNRNKFFLQNNPATKSATTTVSAPCIDSTQTVCDWNQTPQWVTVKGGLIKDQDIINKVSTETGVQARMIAAVVTPEQTRFFTSNREVWKSYFEPLKVLISLSQFSLGISGIKQDTAKSIEVYANNPHSSLYPGEGMNALIAYAPNTNHDIELYNRLTDEKNHYYQYLYTALYIKEIQAQWQKSGYDISHNPETIVTLFNIGFSKSIPNKEPVAGGAPIQLGGKTVLYGELGSDFYYSDELLDVFPKI